MTLSNHQRTPSDSPTDTESSSNNNDNNNHTTTFLPPSITVVNHNDSTSLSTNNSNNIPNKTPVFLRNPTTTTNTTTSSTSQQQQQQAFLPRRKVNTGGNGLLKWYQITAQSDFRKNHLPSYQLFASHQSPHPPMSLSIPKSEVKKHNTEDDCWIIIRGIVYDITPYLKFHPGGVEKLMLGAGRDATQLFDKYHSWVNLDRLLEKCVVGRLSSEF